MISRRIGLESFSDYCTFSVPSVNNIIVFQCGLSMFENCVATGKSSNLFFPKEARRRGFLEVLHKDKKMSCLISLHVRGTKKRWKTTKMERGNCNAMKGK